MPNLKIMVTGEHDEVSPVTIRRALDSFLGKLPQLGVRGLSHHFEFRASAGGAGAAAGEVGGPPPGAGGSAGAGVLLLPRDRFGSDTAWGLYMDAVREGPAPDLSAVEPSGAEGDYLTADVRAALGE